MPSLVTAPLSTAMREGSREQHERAEGSRFIGELLSGRVGAAGYTQYLRCLREVYAALETVGPAHLDDPSVAAVVDPALDRVGALDTDLARWAAVCGEDPTAPARSDAATAYADRVRAAAVWSGGFLAHHYTRYLGDLSGGQAIGRYLAREHGLERDGAGVRFYTFPAVPRPKPYKDAYRARVDALVLDEAVVARVVEEVRVAFALNEALFRELDET